MTPPSCCWIFNRLWDVASAVVLLEEGDVIFFLTNSGVVES
jgi:hypothetical protein